MEIMKRLLIINSATNPDGSKFVGDLESTFRDNLEDEILRQLEIQTLTSKLKDETTREGVASIPLGFDAYLIHPSDVSLDQLYWLRVQNPNSLRYCFGRTERNVSDEERGFYIGFYFFLDRKNVRKIVSDLGIST
jgi:hypothetical protein